MCLYSSLVNIKYILCVLSLLVLSPYYWYKNMVFYFSQIVEEPSSRGGLLHHSSEKMLKCSTYMLLLTSMYIPAVNMTLFIIHSTV
jgi:hypothetical protein